MIDEDQSRYKLLRRRWNGFLGRKLVHDMILDEPSKVIEYLGSLPERLKEYNLDIINFVHNRRHGVFSMRDFNLLTARSEIIRALEELVLNPFSENRVLEVENLKKISGRVQEFKPFDYSGVSLRIPKSSFYMDLVVPVHPSLGMKQVVGLSGRYSEVK